jgi:hypothetical protein
MNCNWKHNSTVMDTIRDVSNCKCDVQSKINNNSYKFRKFNANFSEKSFLPEQKHYRPITKTDNNYGKTIIRSNLQINKDICNNCGKFGHLFRHCKNPIVSFGCVQFRIYNGVREYLMIRRKDTIGYIDFIRGKYLLQDEQYIINMFKQMTDLEKRNILEQNFKTLWDNLWKNVQSTTSLYKTEEETSRGKFNKL